MFDLSTIKKIPILLLPISFVLGTFVLNLNIILVDIFFLFLLKNKKSVEHINMFFFLKIK